jgi:PhnB protein
MVAHPGPTPYLCCKGAADAIGFYERAFAGVVVERFMQPDGRVGHAELHIGSGSIMVADEFPEIGFKSPPTLGGSAVLIHLEVTDLDAAVKRALAAGATQRCEPESDDKGGGRFNLVDPFGHVWILSGSAPR